MNRNVLVLNGDGNCLSIIPLSIIPWQHAVNLIYLEKANVLEIYDNDKLSSPRMTMAFPSVIMLKEYFKHQYNPTFNRGNLLYRDEFKCQYCAKEFHQRHLTIDHVVPKSKGGAKNWTNSVLACQRCNAEKADTYKKPLTLPHVPTYYELATKRKKFPLVIGHMNWNNYLQWDESLLRIGNTISTKLDLGEHE